MYNIFIKLLIIRYFNTRSMVHQNIVQYFHRIKKVFPR